MAKGLSGMLKQVQKMQKKMSELQEQLEQQRVEGSAGGGMVTVVANGRQDILEIKIHPDVVNPQDVEMLEDLILAAIHQAQQRAQEMMNSEMGQITGGLQIPGLSL
ncbi:MAG: YbaB/EbfC family nucleoid-associated protein [candidate division Zixibacteria bacterium]|nr:YbaB/EbfC family nucleoid-associated protein [candidate division Zixibacteria bacterium]